MEGVHAHEFGSNSPYIKLSVPSLGTVTLYVPQNQAENLSLSEGGQIVNSSSNTITLYTNDNDYSWSIATYSYIRYRTSTSSTYQYVSNGTVLESNFLDITGGKIQSYNKDYIMIGLLFIIGVGVFCSWWKR